MRRRSAEREEFDEEVTRLTAQRIDQQNSKYLMQENVLHYRHGDQWAHVDAASDETGTGNFKKQSAETTMNLKYVVDNDVTVIGRVILEMSEKMHGLIATTMFETIGAAAEEIGNQVNIAAKKPDGALYDEAMQDGFREMVKRVELAVDKFGAPSFPTMYISPDNRRVIDFINGPKDPAFELEIDQIRAGKEKRAVAEEVGRLMRFRRK